MTDKTEHHNQSQRFTFTGRGEGVTDAERYLKRLCDHSFLSLWSYAGIYRDQWLRGGVKEGKEVCDLLVVFENHIIIFSDKDCAYPEGDDPTVNWRRWFKKAVQKSADQIWGAERWIKSHPQRLFLDHPCTRPFPLELPDPATATFHRILVAHGISEQCRKVLGGSGSLIIAPRVIDPMHTTDNHAFTIGQLDPARGYVHVFDDTSLETVMHTLDTITDFVAYLTKKERFIQSGRLLWAAGEDDLLAYYLRDINSDGEHDFIFAGDPDVVAIDEGFWSAFCTSRQREEQLKANEVSYFWDYLIEKFATHIQAGTQYYTSHPRNIYDGERIMRFLAREPRTRRRMLAQSLLDIVATTPPTIRRTRVMLPSYAGDPYYVFLLLPHLPRIPEDEYRLGRRTFLEYCCMVTKFVYPDAQDIVGIATETGRLTADRSEDALYLDARCWTEEMQAEAQQIQQELGLLTNLTNFASVEQEYPSMPSKPVPPMKGKERNHPCPCGSGKKFKKCCGR